MHAERSRLYRSWVLTAACAILAMATPACGEDDRPEVQPAGGGGSAEPDRVHRFDFGEVPVGSETWRPLELLDSSGGPAVWRLERVVGPFYVELPAGPVSLGRSSEVRVGVEPAAPGAADGWVVLSSDAETVMVLLRAEARSPSAAGCLEASPAEVTFADVCRQERVRVALRNACEWPIELSSLMLYRQSLDVEGRAELPVELQPGSEWAVELGYEPFPFLQTGAGIAFSVTGVDEATWLPISVVDTRATIDHVASVQAPIEKFDLLIVLDPSALDDPWRSEAVRYLEFLEWRSNGSLRIGFTHTVVGSRGGACPDGGELLPIDDSGALWLEKQPGGDWIDWLAVLDRLCVPEGDGHGLATLATSLEQLPTSGFVREKLALAYHLVSARDDMGTGPVGDWVLRIKAAVAKLERTWLPIWVVAPREGSCTGAEAAPRYESFVEAYGWISRDLCGNHSYSPPRISRDRIPLSLEPADSNSDGRFDEADGILVQVPGQSVRCSFLVSWREATVACSPPVRPGATIELHYPALACH